MIICCKDCICCFFCVSHFIIVEDQYVILWKEEIIHTYTYMCAPVCVYILYNCLSLLFFFWEVEMGNCLCQNWASYKWDEYVATLFTPLCLQSIYLPKRLTSAAFGKLPPTWDIGHCLSCPVWSSSSAKYLSKCTHKTHWGHIWDLVAQTTLVWKYNA